MQEQRLQSERRKGLKWGAYRPAWGGCASWSSPPKPQSQRVGKVSGHRSVHLIPSQRLPEEQERKRQLTASSWLPRAGVKEQDSLTPPPFPLKTPQARSCLAGGCQVRAISTLCFLLIGGINNLLLLSIHPKLFCTEKGKAKHEADFVLTRNHNNTTATQEWALVCPFSRGGVGGMRL